MCNMYSHEITQTMESNNYNIDSEIYFQICNSSPQIDHIKYDPCERCHEMWSNDGYNWKFKVYQQKDN